MGRYEWIWPDQGGYCRIPPDTGGYGRIQVDTGGRGRTRPMRANMGGHGRVRVDTAEFGRIWVDRGEYGWIRADTVGYGWAAAEYGWIRADAAGYGRIRPGHFFQMFSNEFRSFSLIFILSHVVGFSFALPMSLNGCSLQKTQILGNQLFYNDSKANILDSQWFPFNSNALVPKSKY